VRLRGYRANKTSCFGSPLGTSCPSPPFARHLHRLYRTPPPRCSWQTYCHEDNCKRHFHSNYGSGVIFRVIGRSGTPDVRYHSLFVCERVARGSIYAITTIETHSGPLLFVHRFDRGPFAGSIYNIRKLIRQGHPDVSNCGTIYTGSAHGRTR